MGDGLVAGGNLTQPQFATLGGVGAPWPWFLCRHIELIYPEIQVRRGRFYFYEPKLGYLGDRMTTAESCF